MTAFIFFISFLLHIITLTAIVQLLKQIKQLKQTNSSEIMDLFETYLEEIKDENRHLEEKLMNSSNDTPADFKLDLHDQPEAEPIAGEEEVAPDRIISDVAADDSFETSLQARVLQLYDQGLSSEEIAQKLNCGKTEAALIIKIHTK